MVRKTLFFLGLITVLWLGRAFAQVSYDSLETVYYQGFDALPATGTTFTWTDNSPTLLPGWYAATSVGTGFNPAGITTGSTTSGGLYSFGSSGAADRALGSIGSGSAGNFYWGVKLVNNTSTTITGFTISYTGEQWRNSAAAAQALTASYSLTATDLKTGTYQTVPTLGFTSPITGGTAGALNGNLAANRTVVGPVTVSNISWVPGGVLWIRFYDPDHTGTDHALSIDDFSFQAAGSASGDSYSEPVGYYSAATGLTGVALQNALHNIISPHTVIPYTSGSVDVWAALKVLDEDPADSTKVRLIYSETSELKTSTSIWDREHLWPQSRGVSGSGSDYSDLFNLRPILGTINSARGNKFYDTSDPTSTGYHSPATTGAAADSSTDSDSWEPPDVEKGPIARALFYMDVRYDGADSGTSDLVLENAIGNPADMAVLSTLVTWSDSHPVTMEERKRNSKIYTDYQHNRNPFVDHPEWVDLIYEDAIRSALDSDLDGMPSAWETANSLNPANPADANADPENDGFSNFEEWWMGTDPHSGTAPARLIVDKAYTGAVEDGSDSHPFKTIQGAADAASATTPTAILVKPGTYAERPYIHDKGSVFVFSTDGADQTIIDATGGSSSAVRIYDFQRAAFVGFTVRNATTTWYGAGVRVDAPNGAILLAENKLTGNTSTSSSNGGGGLYLRTGAGSRVINNFITGNQAVRGGGVLFGGGSAEFWFNTVAGNTATGGNGGGLSALQGVQPDIRDNIVWGNIGGISTAQIHQITTLSSNILQGAASGSGNINTDPLFVGGGDYHVMLNSPAKNTAVALPNGKDIDADLRPDASNSSKDLGADEIVDPTGGVWGTVPDAWKQRIVDFSPTDAIASLTDVLPGDDFDHDGLTNVQEFQAGLDPTNPDSDFDGVSDHQEQIDGTSPNDPGNVTQRRISSFPFDTANFAGREGQLPTTVPGCTSATSVVGFSGNAMHVDQLSQLLRYEWARPDGSLNYSIRRGSVRLWFKLDWTPGTNAMSGYWSRLFDLGLFGASQVALHFNLDNPIFQFYQADGAGHDFTTWSDFSNSAVAAGEWHQIVVTYSPTAQKLYLDGVLITASQTWNNGVLVGETGTTWDHSPKISDFAQLGLKFGSDSAQPLRGAIDEAEFFNYELTPTQIQADFASADTDDDGLSDAWEMATFGDLDHDLTTDTDGDGITDVDEIHVGTDPQDFWNGHAPVLEIVSGNNQGDLPGQTLVTPLNVRVTNASGKTAIAGSVMFAITSSSGGSLGAASVAINPADGTASTSFTLPTTVGASITVTATAHNSHGSAQGTFLLSVGDASSAPAAPSRPVVVEDHGVTQALVKWEDLSNNETAFYVERRSYGESWQRLATLPANSTSYMDTTVVPDKLYDYQIVAHNEAP